MAIFDRLRKLFGASRDGTSRDGAPAVEAPAAGAAGDDGDAPESTSAPSGFADDATRDPDAALVFGERRAHERRAARAGLRMLLVDDSATILVLLGRMLRQNGYETLDAADAEAGLALAFAEPPDLIFLDIVLPGMNGFAALRALRRDARTRHVPIIMISGNEQATEEFYLYRIGADDFMKKPFSRAEVFARIERLLDDDGVPRRIGTAAMAGRAEATAPPG